MKPRILSCALALLMLPGIGAASENEGEKKGLTAEADPLPETGSTNFRVDLTTIPEPAVALLGSIGLLILLLRRK
ncbi:hypothetical protein [Luteolibacter luteus]|uniref:PEP-CTERM sorting domain-containing protein n=1 Tax=Luteolibacter luteus TaxID=2728835 RepID=A0A858RPU2_9BACT|nr:hypothetical protein [Luteolibacter luteus]QJE98369.1 hypothetical protein HHL09_22140 [Luteolibacter luteus]